MTTVVQELINQHLQASPDQIADFCQCWKIAELALFGCILREDYRPDSDIDGLVTLVPDEQWSRFD